MAALDHERQIPGERSTSALEWRASKRLFGSHIELALKAAIQLPNQERESFATNSPTGSCKMFDTPTVRVHQHGA